jgi:hypothetical protein
MTSLGKRNVLHSPLVSALLGGVNVAAFGWVAIAAGWVKAHDVETTTVAAPLATPVATPDGDGEASTVNQTFLSPGHGRPAGRLPYP